MAEEAGIDVESLNLEGVESLDDLGGLDGILEEAGDLLEGLDIDLDELEAELDGYLDGEFSDEGGYDDATSQSQTQCSEVTVFDTPDTGDGAAVNDFVAIKSE